jgi:alpha-amylase
MERISTNADTSIFAFTRIKEGDKIFVIANLSGEVKEAKLRGDAYKGSYKEWFTGEEVTFKKNTAVRMKPWEYKVYVGK